MVMNRKYMAIVRDKVSGLYSVRRTETCHSMREYADELRRSGFRVAKIFVRYTDRNMNTKCLETLAEFLYRRLWRSCDRLELAAVYGFSDAELDFICCLLSEMEK